MTRLEAHFLRSVTKAVREREVKSIPVSELYLLFPDDEPGLKLALRIPGSPLFYVKILIYGSRPVRYQIETSVSQSTSLSRRLWDHCLGPLSLVHEKSGVRKDRLQLFYEVTYPEAFLKRLGE